MTILSVPYFMGEPIDHLVVPDPDEIIAPPLPTDTPQHRMAVLYRTLAGRIEVADRPLVFAGDCVASIGVLAGLQRRGIEPTLIWYDAHGDFNTWDTTPSGFLGGMPLAMMVGRGEQTVTAGAGSRPLEEAKVILVGARDLDPGEDEALRASAVRLSTVRQISEVQPPPGELWVHVDVDVVDPSEMPAVNYPAPGGPSLAEVKASLSHLAATGRVVAVSVSTWNPDLTGAGTAAEATDQLVRTFLG